MLYKTKKQGNNNRMVLRNRMVNFILNDDKGTHYGEERLQEGEGVSHLDIMAELSQRQRGGR